MHNKHVRKSPTPPLTPGKAAKVDKRSKVKAVEAKAKRFACQDCPELDGFDNRFELKKHLISVHRDDGKIRVACGLCFKVNKKMSTFI